MEKKKLKPWPLPRFLMKYKYLIAVIAVGFFLLLLPQEKNNVTEKNSTLVPFEVEKFEKRVENALSECSGVGRCEVILSIDSGPANIYEKESKESERENEGGVMLERDSDTKPSILSEGSGRESPLVIKEVYPEFRGAMIICDGAESASVRSAITSSVTALTGLSADKISIIKMKN